MKNLNEGVVSFLKNQGFVIVSSVDKDGMPHNACKGIIDINQNGLIYLLDLYKAKTYDNLKANLQISITSVDEHKFKGFCLKGKAKEVRSEKLTTQLVKSWEEKITSRLSQRVLRNLHGEKGHPRHPEVLLPKPKYLIAMEVEEVVDLTPAHMK